LVSKVHTNTYPPFIRPIFIRANSNGGNTTPNRGCVSYQILKKKKKKKKKEEEEAESPFETQEIILLILIRCDEVFFYYKLHKFTKAIF
jgi:hypothetical protein